MPNLYVLEKAILTEAVENYLTEILRLEEADTPASTSVLADRLGVARPSVTGMLKRLASDRLLVHEPYRAVVLTRRGRKAARAVVRRHRIVETFLVDVLKMSPDKVHPEAHRLEHALSDEVLERLFAFLGSPEHDPHGSPIPGPD